MTSPMRRRISWRVAEAELLVTRTGTGHACTSLEEADLVFVEDTA